MQVKLLHSTPLEVADIAICKCYGSKPYIDLEKTQARINRVANVSKHSSTIEHLVYTFDIDGISRAVLQELARHRIASYTVKSTRYTLQELKKAEDILESGYLFFSDKGSEVASKFIVATGDKDIDGVSVHNLGMLQKLLKKDKSNDLAKYTLPEAYKTSLVMTINARALQNFIELRTSKHALWEIQDLAKAMYEQIPADHIFLFKDYLYDQNGTTTKD